MKSFGFSIVELLVVMGIFAILVAFSMVNFFSLKAHASLATTANILVSDLKTQQIKAMNGDAQTPGGANTNFGIHVQNGNYILFQNAYVANAPKNFLVILGDSVTGGSSFANGDVIFSKGSGATGITGTITLIDSANSKKIININRLGVVTSVTSIN